jgi:hypothetical protein
MDVGLEFLLQCELKGFDTPHSIPTWDKGFLGLVSIQAPVSSNKKITFFVFFYVCH